MNSNPYDPPRRADVAPGISPLLRVFGQFIIVFYGVLFTSFRVWGTIDGIRENEPIVETMFWLVVDGVTCYGIFALAIPQLQSKLVARLWRYVAYALPVLILASTGLGIWNGETMSGMDTSEFIAFLMLFLIFITPALAFNFMLHRKLNLTQKRIHIANQ